MKNRYMGLMLALILVVTLVASCGAGNKQTLKVYNWGEYIDPQIIKDFEAENNVKVVYSTYDTNEAMYNKIVSGTVTYDVLVPSDYMIDRMVKEDLLEPLNYQQIPNFSQIKPDLLNADFDKQQLYSVPYFWGTVGILYDKTKVTEPVTSWNILWEQKYEQQIFMYNSARDAMMVALKKLGFSMNTRNPLELNAAKEQLLAQRPLVFGYVGDEVINGMINNQAALAVVYSGDATTIMKENPNMAYAIPTEGSNIWVDAMVIPKNAENKELAHKFIDYLSGADVSALNTEAVGFSTPNKQTMTDLTGTAPWVAWLSYNPDLRELQKMEYFLNPDEETNKLYTQIWESVISS
ncbi:MAG: ABC transporter substrate-binding protein [Culicoidibacterales bacterium]